MSVRSVLAKLDNNKGRSCGPRHKWPVANKCGTTTVATAVATVQLLLLLLKDAAAIRRILVQPHPQTGRTYKSPKTNIHAQIFLIHTHAFVQYSHTHTHTHSLMEMALASAYKALKLRIVRKLMCVCHSACMNCIVIGW